MQVDFASGIFLRIKSHLQVWVVYERLFPPDPAGFCDSHNSASHRDGNNSSKNKPGKTVSFA
jgi:hypothetical protein